MIFLLFPKLRSIIFIIFFFFYFQQGRDAEARRLAKELVRLRQQQEKLKQTKTTLQCVSNRATVGLVLKEFISLIEFTFLSYFLFFVFQAAGATVSVSNAMAGATRAMSAANSQINMQAVQDTMMNFQRQAEYMDMTDEYDNIFFFFFFLCLVFHFKNVG